VINRLRVHALTRIAAERSGPLVASASEVTRDVTQFLVRAFAVVRATLHCLLKHGGGPVEKSYHHHIVLCCPVCGRVFWRKHTPA